MIKIRREKHLARQLGLEVADLRDLADNFDSYCEEFLLQDPAKPAKFRRVLNITGPLRRVQNRIYKRILLPNLAISNSSYGGVRGRSIKLNAAQHLRSSFVYSCDIMDFYPGIHSKRVYRYFTTAQGCAPNVARLLTRLCTYRYHLALGLTTSPLLADQFLQPVDNRIAQAASLLGVVYSRFVDDITVSGHFDLRESGFAHTIGTILRAHGFATNRKKDQHGCLGEPDVLITKLRLNRGEIDVSKKYLDDLCLMMSNLAILGQGGEFSGPYYTSQQIWGRIQFTLWIKPGRRRQLIKMYKAIPWKRVRAEAERRGLVVCKKSLIPIADPSSIHSTAVPV